MRKKVGDEKNGILTQSTINTFESSKIGIDFIDNIGKGVEQSILMSFAGIRGAEYALYDTISPTNKIDLFKELKGMYENIGKIWKKAKKIAVLLFKKLGKLVKNISKETVSYIIGYIVASYYLGKADIGGKIIKVLKKIPGIKKVLKTKKRINEVIESITDITEHGDFRKMTKTFDKYKKAKKIAGKEGKVISSISETGKKIASNSSIKEGVENYYKQVDVTKSLKKTTKKISKTTNNIIEKSTNTGKQV